MKKMTVKGIILLGMLLLAMTAVSAASAGERTLVLPADVMTIEMDAFRHTDAETIILPAGVTTIGDGAFGESPSLKAVYVPAALMDREEAALEGSENAHFYPLTEESLFETTGTDSLTITKYKGTQTAVAIPASIGGKPVTAIGNNAFNNSNSRNLTRVVIPEGITTIGDGAFYDNQYLENVDFPSTLTTIGGGAFAYCGNKVQDHVFCYRLPDGLTSIVQGNSSSDTFNSCPAVKVVTAGSATAHLLSHPDFTMTNENGYKKQWFTFAGQEEAGFRYLYFTEEGQDNLRLMKYYGNASELTIPVIPGSLITDIAANTFQNNTMLTKCVIPEGVKTIGAACFEGCTNLTDITFPDSLQTIGSNAFTRCGNNAAEAYYFRLPDHITSITTAHSTNDSFANCKAVRIVTPGSETAYVFSDGMINAQDPAAAYPYHWFTFPGEGQADFRYLYYTEELDGTEQRVLHLIKYTGNDEEVTIPAQAAGMPVLGVIQAEAFKNNGTIRKLIIPDTVRRFGRGAFAGCGYLTDVHFPAALEYLEENVFTDCGDLYTQEQAAAGEDWEFTYDLPDNIIDLVYNNSNLDTFYSCEATLHYNEGTRTWSTIEYKKQLLPQT